MLFRLQIRGMHGFWLACCEKIDSEGILLSPQEALDLLAALSARVGDLVQIERAEHDILPIGTSNDEKLSSVS